ncbi:MAG: ferritin-like domain-containing protein, partial [Halobacteriales archaeon]
QIGVVLEEVVEARAYHHYRALAEESGVELDPEIAELLEHAREESADHRERLENLIDELDAESVPFEEVEALVREQYGQSRPEDFDGVLYDQLAGEETAYKFYDDLIQAIEASDATFSVERDRLVAALTAIREEEADGVEEVTDVMRGR